MLKHLFIQTKQKKIILLSILTLVLSACGQKEVTRKPPTPAVSVYQLESQKVGSYREFVARTEAFKEASLRARVEGELLEQNFKEGTVVDKGQVLLKIDPTAYNTALASAKAALNSTLSTEGNAVRNLKRANELIGDGYISQSDFDKLTTEESQAKAAVESAKAEVNKAELNLSYTTIIAPFTGRIGRINYDVGNVIGPNSDVLATLTITNPIHVNFQIEESLYVSYLQEHKNANEVRDVDIDLSLRLPNNSEYGHKGVLDFADTKIDQGMGTVELRAAFSNKESIILPGLFVTLIVESKSKTEMVLVPQVAVQEGQQGKFVLVVDEQNKVKQRPVVLGRRINAMWAVEKGLIIDENVIVEGLQKVRPGVEVKSVMKNIDALTGIISDVNSSDMQVK
jgi:membrane fusion protein (multidrug efflux system)